ncbi:MAG: protein-export chaperone SecB [Thiomargarita sp.]|nr:protein-export chaperone SecB [Thiomargarita sp.]
MAETDNQANNQTDTQEQFGIQNIYIKDISFESPNVPKIFAKKWKPKLELEISNKINQLDKELFEVVLNLTVTVKGDEDKTVYLIEIHQAGIFIFKNFVQDKLTYMLNSYCPNVLFPYARETVSSIVSKGGFQPLWLSPINFDALYAQQVKKKQEEAAKQQNDSK